MLNPAHRRRYADFSCGPTTPPEMARSPEYCLTFAIRRNAGHARWSGAGSVQDQDFHAAVGAPSLRRVVGGDRARLAQAFGGQPVRRELEAVDEDLLDQFGAAFRQLLVVCRAPLGIAVADDQNLPVTVHADQFRDLGERVVGARPHLIAAHREQEFSGHCYHQASFVQTAMEDGEEALHVQPLLQRQIGKREDRRNATQNTPLIQVSAFYLAGTGRARRLGPLQIGIGARRGERGGGGG